MLSCRFHLPSLHSHLRFFSTSRNSRPPLVSASLAWQRLVSLFRNSNPSNKNSNSVNPNSNNTSSSSPTSSPHSPPSPSHPVSSSSPILESLSESLSSSPPPRPPSSFESEKSELDRIFRVAPSSPLAVYSFYCLSPSPYIREATEQWFENLLSRSSSTSSSRSSSSEVVSDSSLFDAHVSSLYGIFRWRAYEDMDDAYRLLEKGIRVAPHSSFCHYLIGLFEHHGYEDIPFAQRRYEKALELEPSHPEIICDLAHLHIIRSKKSHFDIGLTMLDQNVLQFPNHTRSLIWMAYVHDLAHRNIAQASKLYVSSLTRNPINLEGLWFYRSFLQDQKLDSELPYPLDEWIATLAKMDEHRDWWFRPRILQLKSPLLPLEKVLQLDNLDFISYK